MVQNQEFTDQLQRLIGEIPQKVSESMVGIQSTQRDINDKILKLGNELQYLMQQMNKSSLFKTTVSLSSKTMECYNKKEQKRVDVKVHEILTFNHKGIGSMQVSEDEDAQPCGSTYSNPLNVKRLFSLLSNKELHQQILMDLAVHGKKNAMPIWVEVMKIHDECDNLLKMGERHKYDIVFDVKEEVTVKVPDLEDGKVIMKPLDIDKIKFANDHELVLLSPNSIEVKRLSVHTLEDYLVFIQFNEELYSIMKQCNDDLDTERERVNENISSIHTKLATHFVTIEMNENFEAIQEQYYW